MLLWLMSISTLNQLVWKWNFDNLIRTHFSSMMITWNGRMISFGGDQRWWLPKYCATYNSSSWSWSGIWQWITRNNVPRNILFEVLILRIYYYILIQSHGEITGKILCVMPLNFGTWLLQIIDNLEIWFCYWGRRIENVENFTNSCHMW